MAAALSALPAGGSPEAGEAYRRPAARSEKQRAAGAALGGLFAGGGVPSAARYFRSSPGALSLDAGGIPRLAVCPEARHLAHRLRETARRAMEQSRSLRYHEAACFRRRQRIVVMTPDPLRLFKKRPMFA